MLRKTLIGWALVSIGLFIGCKPRQARLSMSDEEAIQLLADIHSAEAAAQHLPNPTRDSMVRVYYDQVFRLHHTDQAAYEELVVTLRKDPDRMSKLYEKVVEELAKRETGTSN